MQLSMELLPAPLGPMMARTSCSRTLNEMSVSALTPPKLREMFLTSRMTSPMFLFAMVVSSCSGGCLDGRKGFCVVDSERGADAAGAAIFKLDLGFNKLRAAPFVQGIHQGFVFLRD